MGSGKTATVAAVADAAIDGGRSVFEYDGDGLLDADALQAFDLVVVDDVHRLSEGERDTLVSLAGERRASVSIVVTAPTHVPGTEDLVVLAGGFGTLTDLGPLTQPEQAELLAAIGHESDTEDLLRETVRETAGNTQLFDLVARGRSQASVDAVVRSRLAQLPTEQRGNLVRSALQPGSVPVDPLQASGLVSGDGAVAEVALGELGASFTTEDLEALVAEQQDYANVVAASNVARSLGAAGDAVAALHVKAGRALLETNAADAEARFTLAGPSGVADRALAFAAAGKARESREVLANLPGEVTPNAHGAMALLATGRSDWSEAATIYADLGNHVVPGSPVPSDRLADLCRLVAGAGGSQANAGSTGLDTAIALLEATTSKTPPDDLDDAMRALARSSLDLDPTLTAPLGVMELGAIAALASSQFTTATTLLDASPESSGRSPVTEALADWVRCRGASDSHAAAEKATERAANQPAAPPVAAQLLQLASRSAAARAGQQLDLAEVVMDDFVRIASQLPVDLVVLDALSELVTLSHRLDRRSEAHRIGGLLEQFITRIGEPLLWAARVHYALLEATVLSGDLGAVAAAADAVENTSAQHESTAPLARAAGVWRNAISGAATTADTIAVAIELLSFGLYREADFLVGQAAIRSVDPAVTKSLLSWSETKSGDFTELTEPSMPQSAAGLSTREIEIGERILAGDTYREIADTCFISVKTVEHHVGHIRQKLLMVGARRAEFKAALRTDLGVD